MARLRQNFFTGSLSSPLLAGATTLLAAELSTFIAVTGSDDALITIGDTATADCEIVRVTAHTAASTSATIERAFHGTDREWPAGTAISNTVSTFEIPQSVTQAGYDAADVDPNGVYLIPGNVVYTRLAPSGDTTGVTDTAAIQAALAVDGAWVELGPGVFYISDTLVIGSGHRLWGSGLGGDVFSRTDVLLPWYGTVLSAVAGLDDDVIRTENFATLTGDSTPDGYLTPSRFSIRDLVVDGNKANNTGGCGIKIFGRAYDVSNVTIQNTDSDGFYSEYGTGGYEMEASVMNLRVTDCGGDGIEWRGPHDSQFTNLRVARNAGRGINLVAGSSIGGEQFSNTHCWGNTLEQWLIGTSNGDFTNCVSDGGGIVFMASGNIWDGRIYGTQTPGEWAVMLGDGTSVTVGQNVVRGRAHNFVGSPTIIQRASCTSSGNRFDLTANMGLATRYFAKGLPVTLTTAAITSDTTLNTTDTTELPASGTLYADDGTTRTAALVYTGKTASTLTGVTGIPVAGLLDGACLFKESALSGTSDLGGDSLEVYDYDSTSAGGIQRWRVTPNGGSTHGAIVLLQGRFFAEEGIALGTGSAGPANVLEAGSAAPTHAARTVGDRYYRTGVDQVYRANSTAGGASSWTLQHPAFADTLDQFALTTGEETIPRLVDTTVSPASGQLYLTYFKARKTEQATQIVQACASAAGATPTLCRVGVYSVAGNGDLTLAAAITSDTTMFATGFTEYTRTLTSGGFAKVAGDIYAYGLLVVSGASMPTFPGVNLQGAAATIARAPRRTARLTGQTDLPASITAATINASTASGAVLSMVLP